MIEVNYYHYQERLLIHKWNLRYTRFSPEEAMVGLEKMDHLNRIIGFGSNGGIYSIASG